MVNPQEVQELKEKYDISWTILNPVRPLDIAIAIRGHKQNSLVSTFNQTDFPFHKHFKLLSSDVFRRPFGSYVFVMIWSRCDAAMLFIGHFEEATFTK